MRERWHRLHNTTHLSVTLCVVVFLGSLLWFASAVSEGRDEEDSDTCDTPHWHPLDETLLVYPLNSIASTQDEAKRIAEEEGWKALVVDNDNNNNNPPPPPRSFVVTTREQTQGRGTNGRSWMGQRGNVFCTIGIRQSDWIQTKIPLTLLPLKVGSLVAQHVQRLLDECISGSQDPNGLPMVTVKWPNDVLVNEQKISGILIESSLNGWFLIGIGINLAYAPQVAMTGPDRGRPATSISNLCSEQESSSPLWGEKQAQQLGIDLAYDLHSFLLQENADLGTRVLEDWKQWIDWDMELVMRDTPEQERVRMVGVLPDGRVQVRNVDDGRIRTLVSDYFL